MLTKQQGSTLIISLIMLLLLTIVGMAGMRMTGLEERMAGNFRNHALAFQAAEAALAEAEAYVENTAFKLTDFQTGCSGSQCFTSSCANGLCFNGTFPSGTTTPVKDCLVGTTKPWESWALWADSSKTRAATGLTGTSATAKYIVEFRCYVLKDPSFNSPDKTVDAQWSLAFRITALGKGGTDDAQSMLQTTYKKLNF